MSRDRAPIFIAMTDLLLCLLAVTILAVSITKAKTDGVKTKAEYLITADWDVKRDIDVDLWAQTPSGKPVFYGSRDVGCYKLDNDNRGFMDGHVTLADGSQTAVESNKETISLRCIEPGQTDIAVSLFADYESVDADKRDDIGVKVHVEIVKVNPEVKLVYSKDVVLNRVKQSINVESFVLNGAGEITLTDPPLESVVDRYYHKDSGASVP